MVVECECVAAESTRTNINRFLALRRFAAVGVSKNPRDFTRQLLRSFLKKAYDVVPVNPGVAEMEGRTCYATLHDIKPPVKAALLLTSPIVTEQVVQDCAACGISLIWMYRAAGAGAVSDKAVELCRVKGISVIPGECPLMFLPHSGFVHHAHGFFRKIAGTYPR